MTSKVIFFCALSLLFPASVFGADWPTFRADAARSGAVAAELPATLRLQWTRKLPPLEPAWPDEPLLWFDAAYVPVIAGDVVFIASPRADSVTAYSATDGAELWRFYCDGPVRFAPTVWKNRVLFVSDDGFLYCLNSTDGRLLWKFRGGPDERRLLGNKRLISAWPARGAPAVADGTAYFAAGIWPLLGVFFHALDVESGKPLWTQDGLAPTYLNRPHNSSAFSGPAPQGYLSLVGDCLLIPNGRTVPLGLARDTGALLFHHVSGSGWRTRGGPTIIGAGDYFFNAGKIFDLKTGNLSGSATREPPMAVADGIVFRADNEGVAAFDLQRAKREEASSASSLQVTMPQKWTFSFPWKTTTTALVKAGSRLYVGTKGLVATVNLSPKGEPTLGAQLPISGTPWNLAVAAERLFVATREGELVCWGAEKKPPIIYELPTAALPVTDAGTEEVVKTAEALLRSTPGHEGCGVFWGVGSGQLLEALARRSDRPWIAVDPDEKKIAALRRKFDDAGIYGTRIALCAGEPLTFALPPYLAGLLTVADEKAAGLDNAATFTAKAAAVLRPYGGTLALRVAPAVHDALTAAFPADEPTRPFGAWKAENGLTQLVRGALPDAGVWTHQYADAANTNASVERHARLPMGLLWFGGHSHQKILPRHGHGPVPHVVDGRVIVPGANILWAYDAYTGRVLWKADFPGLGKPYDTTSHQPGANALGGNYVSTADAVYVIHGERCVRLDPSTGQKTKEFTLPAPPGGPLPIWSHLVLWKDLLIAGTEPAKFVEPYATWTDTATKKLVGLNRHTGEILWSFDALCCFRDNAVAVGGGKVFFTDLFPEAMLKELRAGKLLPAGAPRLGALDAQTGKPLWSTRENVFGTWLSWSEEHDVLLQAGRASRDMLKDEPRNRIIAYRGKDGTVLWDKPHRHGGPLMLVGRTIYAHAGAFDLLTGEVVTRKHPLTDKVEPWSFSRNYGCGTALASPHLLTFRSASAGWFDLERDGGTGNFGGFKSGCTNNLIPACGILNAPEYTRTCECGYPNQTSLALIHAPDVEMWSFNSLDLGANPIRRVGINFGAPGDRREGETLWLDFPSIGGKSPDPTVTVEPKEAEYFRRHSSRIRSGPLPWVASSGVKGVRQVKVVLIPKPAAAAGKKYAVRLVFAEPDEAQPGERVFNIALQGHTVSENFDIAKEAGEANRAVVKEFRGVEVGDALTVTFAPVPDAKFSTPILCGLEITEE
jgi:outer membrane protein assembly factor BamB